MQLTEKQVRLDSLAVYLRDNGATLRLHRTTRKELCWNAEKIAAAIRGWRFREQTSASSQGVVDELLNSAVLSYLERKKTKKGVDTQESVRFFFKNHVAGIGELFHDIKTVGERKALLAGDGKPGIVNHVNSMLIALYLAASEYRTAHEGIYGLGVEANEGATKKSKSEPWSCTEAMIQVFHDQFLSSFTVVESLRASAVSQRQAADAMVVEDDDEARSVVVVLEEQACQLAQILLSAFNERIEFLEG